MAVRVLIHGHNDLPHLVKAVHDLVQSFQTLVVALHDVTLSENFQQIKKTIVGRPA